MYYLLVNTFSQSANGRCSALFVFELRKMGSSRRRGDKKVAAFFIAALAALSMLVVMIGFISYLALKVRETQKEILPDSADSPTSATVTEHNQQVRKASFTLINIPFRWRKPDSLTQ